MPARHDKSRRPTDSRAAVRSNLSTLSRLDPDRDFFAGVPSLLELERARGLRFIVRAGDRLTSAVVEQIFRDSTGLDCRAEPLFRPIADPSADVIGMERFFLVTVDRISRRDLSVSVFDLAYRVADGAGGQFVTVEPDLPHSVYVGTPEERLERSGWLCNVTYDDAPQDRYWHLRNVRVVDAWSLQPGPTGQRFGGGITVGHPDTGWAEHLELDETALNQDQGHDFVDDDSDARDPLQGGFLWPVSPGHGTATGSVIVSRGAIDPPVGDGAEPDLLAGVAPAATLLPIRAIRFPAFVFDGDVARAIQHAADHGCHVISMSLGGIGTPALEAAVTYAVARNVIVCAAAGNCVGFVAAPAIYLNCIAVAGSNHRDQPWPFSSHGDAVDITAPAEHVWVAHRDRPNQARTGVRLGQGTSFAVATVAGIAALWLAFHGRDDLLSRYQGGPFLHHVFRQVMQSTARRPPTWDTAEYGPGIIDARALLSAALPMPDEVTLRQASADLTITPYPDLIAALFPEMNRTTVEARLGARLGVPDTIPTAASRRELEANAGKWGAELLHILAEDRAAHLAFRLGDPASGSVRARPDAKIAAARLGRLPERPGAEVRRRASAGLRTTLDSAGQ